MNILLDENLDWRLGRDLVGHVTSSVPLIGWAGIKNGQLPGRDQFTHTRDIQARRLPALCNPVVMVYLSTMSTLTLELDKSLAHSLEESARREHKPVATWARERLRIAAMETEAEANGYSAAWLKLFGCIEDESFSAPPRSATRQIESFDEA